MAGTDSCGPAGYTSNVPPGNKNLNTEYGSALGDKTDLSAGALCNEANNTAQGKSTATGAYLEMSSKPSWLQ